jgi:hypothetical protein
LATYPRGYRKKISGIVLFFLGAMLFVTCLMLSFSSLMVERYEVGLVSFIVVITCLLMAIAGVYIFFRGKSEMKKQKNQNTPLA